MERVHLPRNSVARGGHHVGAGCAHDEVPEAIAIEVADAAVGVWRHYPPWRDEHGHARYTLDERPDWDRSRRFDWPTMVWAHCVDAPALTDGCRLHDGRCSGACER